MLVLLDMLFNKSNSANIANKKATAKIHSGCRLSIASRFDVTNG